jgi:hypothetical protein
MALTNFWGLSCAVWIELYHGCMQRPALRGPKAHFGVTAPEAGHTQLIAA